MLTDIINTMLGIFILVTIGWYMICDDVCITTIGFDDRLLSVTKWAFNGFLEIIRS